MKLGKTWVAPWGTMQTSSPPALKLVVGIKTLDAVKKKNMWVWFVWILYSNTLVSGTKILSSLTIKPLSSAVGAQVLAPGRARAIPYAG